MGVAPQRPLSSGVPLLLVTLSSIWWILASNHTYNAILDAKAQLVLQVWPLDEDGGDRRTTDDVHLHLHLVLQALWRNTKRLFLSEDLGMASFFSFLFFPLPCTKLCRCKAPPSAPLNRTLMIP